jgi:hypothetical protein
MKAMLVCATREERQIHVAMSFYVHLICVVGSPYQLSNR